MNGKQIYIRKSVDLCLHNVGECSKTGIFHASISETVYIYMKISSTGTVNKEFSFYDFEIMYCFDKGNQRKRVRNAESQLKKMKR